MASTWHVFLLNLDIVESLQENTYNSQKHHAISGSQVAYVISVLHLTNRFHVSVRLFSNRSQMTSKCGKNKKVAHEAKPIRMRE